MNSLTEHVKSRVVVCWDFMIYDGKISKNFNINILLDYDIVEIYVIIVKLFNKTSIHTNLNY